MKILSREPERSSAGDWSDTSADAQRGIAGIISELPWQSQQNQIVMLLASPDYNQASAAALILTRQPALLNPAWLTLKFASQNTHARRLYCAILASLPQAPDEVRQMFQQALHDPESAVRWRSILAVADQLMSAITNQQTDRYLREKARVTLRTVSATNRVRELVPFGDDDTQ
jgi:hypothetical protein